MPIVLISESLLLKTTAKDGRMLRDRVHCGLIVGGGPAGAAAAVYPARKGIRTGIVAERFGGQVNAGVTPAWKPPLIWPAS
jgi:alkyl hydroperoxide reductase subunit AhpF